MTPRKPRAPRVLADANVVLRFLRDDDAKLSPKARALFESAERGEAVVVLPTVVLAECVWVLDSFYGVARGAIAEALGALIALPGIAADEPAVVADALRRMSRGKLDFADCYLAARAAGAAEPVATFDRGLGRAPGVQAWRPGG